ncbi:hypothetical protein [Amycolatopsis mongoliensis]|uniref:hypothetical protein n=1 Tax=Amycolatopsis mongoliensis TaxID=715475 RepID=UPI0038CBFC74
MARLATYDDVFEFVRPFGAADRVLAGRITIYTTGLTRSAHERRGVVDLRGREAAAPHRYAVPVEDAADRSLFDAEPVTELVHRRAGSVVGDQPPDLSGAELPGAGGARRPRSLCSLRC